MEGLVGENALGVNGIIAPLDGVNYGDWDANRCDPLEANEVVNSIGSIVDNYRDGNPSIEYVVIVGGDDQIPFARVQDHTQLSNEREYATSVSSDNNELFGSLITGFLLTDDPYGDPNPTLIQNERLLYTSEVAIGRLVESPSDILTAIGNFTRFNGRLDPGTSSSSLSTGYDFIEDAADCGRSGTGNRSAPDRRHAQHDRRYGQLVDLRSTDRCNLWYRPGRFVPRCSYGPRRVVVRT